MIHLHALSTTSTSPIPLEAYFALRRGRRRLPCVVSGLLGRWQFTYERHGVLTFVYAIIVIIIIIIVITIIIVVIIIILIIINIIAVTNTIDRDSSAT